MPQPTQHRAEYGTRHRLLVGAQPQPAKEARESHDVGD